MSTGAEKISYSENGETEERNATLVDHLPPRQDLRPPSFSSIYRRDLPDLCKGRNTT